jgi:hypoxanthine phosphoribosyltransferase
VAEIEKDVVSWDELERLVGELAESVRGEYDVMLAITRGGLVPAGILAYALGIRNILIAAVAYYDGEGNPGPEPLFLPVSGRPPARRAAGPDR